MGPPLISWPCSHPHAHTYTEIEQNETNSTNFCRKKCFLSYFVEGLRTTYINIMIILVILHIIMNLSVVGAGPVILSQNYYQGAVSLARNIRHLPCISRRTGQEGVCMFAIDCLKSNGTHLGTCIDRFYFGSCCQVPEKLLPPSDTNIEDNTIDDIHFIPNKEEKNRIKPPKATTEKVITAAFTESVPARTESVASLITDSAVESKTTSDNSIDDDKLTTVQTVETTTQAQTTTTKKQEKVTDQPIKLSTFQTVSFDSNSITENIVQTSSFEKDEISSIDTTLRPKTTTTTTTTQRPTRPTRPSYRPRPPFRPQNATRPVSSTRPTSVRPYKPGVYNTTRKPPYRPPPLRSTTKKPLPIPPRLNITILPQHASSRPPIFTRPVSVTTITFINTTSTTKLPASTTLAPISSTPSSTTTTTVAPSSSTVSSTVESEVTSTKESESATTNTESEISSTPTTTTSNIVELSSFDSLITTQKVNQTSTTNQIVEITSTTPVSTQEIKDVTEAQEDNEISTLRPSVTAEITDVTDFPPGLVTWTNSIDAVTKAPEPQKTTEIHENWSPITPPDGWVLLSTIPPSSPKTEPTTTDDKTTTIVDKTTTIADKTTTIADKTTTIADKTTTIADKTTTIADITTTTIDNNLTTERITTINEIDNEISTVEHTAEDNKVTESLLETNEIATSTAELTTEITQLITENVQQTSETYIPISQQTLSSSEPTQTFTESTKPVTIATEEAESSSVVTQSSTSSSSTTTTTELSSTEGSSESPIPELPSSEAPSFTIPEFTVNITLSSTVPSSTESVSSSSTSPSTVDDSSSTVTVAGNYSDGTTSASNLTDSGVSGGSTQSSLNTTSESSSVPPTSTETYNMSNYKDVCGRRLWPEARIVGGAKSAFGKWPWQISLRQWRTHTYLHKCGAALLNENWAITAAHCVEHVPPSELLVRLGEHDLANEDEPYGFAERRVQIVASHPHFDPATFEYDLALLRFYEPVQFQPNILPVCVPDNDDNYVGKTAHVTGWGRLFDEGPLPSVLQEVEVPVINNTACEAMYQAAGYNEHIPNIFICAGWRKGGSDSCEGDSGGPMVIQRDRDKRFVLGGVISWGIGCAEPNQPGVYTRISEFRDWINQILQF